MAIRHPNVCAKEFKKLNYFISKKQLNRFIKRESIYAGTSGERKATSFVNIVITLQFVNVKLLCLLNFFAVYIKNTHKNVVRNRHIYSNLFFVELDNRQLKKFVVFINHCKLIRTLASFYYYVGVINLKLKFFGIDTRNKIQEKICVNYCSEFRRLRKFKFYCHVVLSVSNSKV